MHNLLHKNSNIFGWMQSDLFGMSLTWMYLFFVGIKCFACISTLSQIWSSIYKLIRKLLTIEWCLEEGNWVLQKNTFPSKKLFLERMEESQAKLGYIQDLHRAYENWLSYKNFPDTLDDNDASRPASEEPGKSRKPKLRIIDANLDEETIEQKFHNIIEEFWKNR